MSQLHDRSAIPRTAGGVQDQTRCRLPARAYPSEFGVDALRVVKAVPPYVDLHSGVGQLTHDLRVDRGECSACVRPLRRGRLIRHDCDVEPERRKEAEGFNGAVGQAHILHPVRTLVETALRIHHDVVQNTVSIQEDGTRAAHGAGASPFSRSSQVPGVRASAG